MSQSLASAVDAHLGGGRVRIGRRRDAGGRLLLVGRAALGVEALRGIVRELREPIGECAAKAGAHAGERNTILRAARPGHRWLHTTEVELQELGEDGLRHPLLAEHPLRSAVALDDIDVARSRVR